MTPAKKEAAPGVVGRKPLVRRHHWHEGWVVSAEGLVHNSECGDTLYIYIPDTLLRKGADE